MTRIVVDANVLLSFLTDRDLEQQKLAAGLLSAAGDGAHEVVFVQSAVSDAVYVLTRGLKQPQASVSECLGELLALPGTRCVHTLDWRTVLQLWPSRFPDYGDALVVASALAARAHQIATFDRSFARRLPRVGLTSTW